MNKMSEKPMRQTSLFGGFVEEEMPPLTFVKVYEEVVDEGDQITMTPTTATLNEEKGCLTLIDTNKSVALTVYFENHPNARFKSTPDGVRLGRAVERALKVQIDELGLLASAFAENDLELNVSHTGEKGRLWVITVL
jgi:hypothetical protein